MLKEKMDQKMLCLSLNLLPPSGTPSKTHLLDFSYFGVCVVRACRKKEYNMGTRRWAFPYEFLPSNCSLNVSTDVRRENQMFFEILVPLSFHFLSVSFYKQD